jgi:subtilisin family serine protease/N-acetylneuraminic acid mutarotase
VVGVAVLALVAALLAFLPSNASGADLGGSAAARDKIQPKLVNSFDADPTRDFWIRMSESADLSRASDIADWNARGKYVYKQLTATADKSQASVRRLLDAREVSYETYWISNAILVKGGTMSLALDLAALPAVEAVRAPSKYELIKPVKRVPDKNAPNVVEWGIANVNADDVWAQFGVTGEGITVASIDTGTQFDHPALVEQYRGNNGDGTFTHDYNWFDAAGNCSGEPCDFEGHGTHTMGTMVGDDGAGNQIGVAPGANWIEANGCCPSDQALIDSGEWFLAPTDLEGNNPDPTMRPHIINNSWGSQIPSNDPFMEDITLAWAAAGMFGVWSNGNIGPSCETSGSPGSLVSNYSVGAADINNNIAGFSSRGPGENDEIKPNITAPGVNVRSSLPGDSYGAFNGTSMAAPHVAGAVALLWSAAPAMVGDIDGTRALLDETALDHEDLTCGGTADDNNVYGEGHLDALALLNAAPIGDTGTLAGTVTDAATGEPIDGAQITITGEAADRNLVTDDDGTYSVLLPVGEYTVDVHAFGYADETATVTVAVDTTTTQDFALDAVPSVTVSGRVTDGSGHGWPLYAKITVEGVPDGTIYTRPATGRYEISLPAGTSYEFRVEPVYPGYQTVTETVEVGSTNVTHPIAVPVDDTTCTAPGYQFNYEGAGATFDEPTVPEGWSVVDNLGNGQVWAFDDPGGRGNLTGGEGGFAIVDSDFYGPDGEQDTSLVSPVMDLSNVANPQIGFQQDYNNLGDSADVDVSIDGGATWETVLHQTEDVRGPNTQLLDIPMAAGEPDVQVRWHYYDASFAWWWQVDSIFIGLRTCDPIEGGLVLGHVTDQNTGGYVNGATVVSDDNPTDRGRSMATPDDEALADGFYWLFSSLTGAHPFTASAGNYTSSTQTVDVEPDWTTQANFVLAAGQLSVAPESVSATVRGFNGTRTRTFEVENTGTAPVDIELGEQKGGFVLARADGSRLSKKEILGSGGAPLNRIPGDFSPLSHAVAGGKADGKSTARIMPHDDPWTNVADYPEDTMDAGVAEIDGTLYSFGGFNGNEITANSFTFDPAANAWSPIAAMPVGRENPAAAAIDGLIYITGGWDPDGTPLTSTVVYDPGADSYTEVAEMPVGVAAPGRAVVDGQLYIVGGCQDACGFADVQRYDPGSDTWEQVADYPEDTAHVGCGAIGGQLYCAGGTATAASSSAYVYDPGADSWSPVADVPSDIWGMAYTAANDMLLLSGGIIGGAVSNEGFAYNPASDSWSELPNSNYTAYRSGSACGLYRVGGTVGLFAPTPGVEVLPGFSDCGAVTDVEWLSVDPTTATLDPGDTLTVEVTMSSESLEQPGTYTAGVQVKENTPYAAPKVGVSFRVNPPTSWGKLAGTVNGVDCSGNRTALPGTTVQIDSWAGDWTLVTDTAGQYAYWIDRRANPLTVIAAKDGYKPQVKTARLRALETVTLNFNLQKRGC